MFVFWGKKLQNSSFQGLPKFDVFYSVWDTEKKHVLFTTKLHGRSLSCGPFTQLSGSSLKDNEWSAPQWKPAYTPSWISPPNASSESSSSKREELLNPSPPVTKNLELFRLGNFFQKFGCKTCYEVLLASFDLGKYFPITVDEAMVFNRLFFLS